jgi:hydroxymethylbilane synthase
MTEPIVIATRESRLALWQAEHVRDLLVERLGLAATLLAMTTRGDRILDRTLSKIGGKGLFIKELETALADSRARLAVHSLKDVPMELEPAFALAAVLPREDARDAFVSPHYASLAELPPGGVVGTSSLRRVVQLRALRPDLRIVPLRGNLDTRLRKLDEGRFDAIVLAAAGLKRLGLAARIRRVFEADEMLPCAGQGALALEVRADDAALRAQLAPLKDPATWLAVQAERAVSRTLGGSCSMPLAAHAVWQGDELVLRAAVGHPGTPLEDIAPEEPAQAAAADIAADRAMQAAAADIASDKAAREGTNGAQRGTTPSVAAPQGASQSEDWAPLLRVRVQGAAADDAAAVALGQRAAAELLAAGAADYLTAAR